MNFTPTAKNSRLVNSIIVLSLIFGAITYTVPAICQEYGVTVMPWLFGLLTIASVVTALYFFVRYKMTGFIYMICPRSDIDIDPNFQSASFGGGDVTRMSPKWLDFVVMKSQGSRTPIKECVMSFEDLVEVMPIARKKTDGATHDDVAKKYRERSVADFAFYDYTLTYRWEKAVELIFVDGQRYVGIIVEGDEELIDAIRRIRKTDV